MDTSDTARTVLQSNFLFRDLPEDSIAQIAAIAKRRKFAKGEIVFSQGDKGDALYGVVAGKVRITASDENGHEVFLNIMEPGESFGEIALIDGRPRTASATLMEDSVLWVIQRADFLRLMHADPRLPIHLLQLFCERIRWTSELIEESAFLNVPQRLGTRLLRLAESHGERTVDGVSLKISQGELAQFLSISRQIVNQYLQDWRRAEVIHLARGRITIVDPEGLTALFSDSND